MEQISENPDKRKTTFSNNEQENTHRSSTLTIHSKQHESAANNVSLKYFADTRHHSLILCEPLDIEDYGLQAAAYVSPPKWHLAHTTWFFETFILIPFLGKHYTPFHPSFETLFNSYYNGVGTPFSRPHRGLLSKPSLSDILSYRQYVDEHIVSLLKEQPSPDIIQRLTLGLHHEQQHQELLLTDILYNFSFNPLFPAYEGASTDDNTPDSIELTYAEFAGGITSIGQSVVPTTHANTRFCFDNETPKHDVLLSPYSLANRLITNEEFLHFIEYGGYSDPLLWLSDGWQHRKEQNWTAPLYWHKKEETWWQFTLHGLMPLPLSLPVTNISYYEADAFARWAGARLPTEFEWEHAAKHCTDEKGYFIEDATRLRQFLPACATESPSLQQLFGSTWEWTSSSYAPYPGFTAARGAIGEYNGKFMCNQMVLRGGSFATHSNHIRMTYRNFFYPKDRWQFSGIRLAR
ncbi:ergothioneine biosynthesis protein EgtB [Aestuariibacter sp. AA17]|uniref:Ergothioneine biosynthesis protein EgtB n=1 Tax=Fluctibacter corallii TaxID=2984329 RepID=A0ABT3AC85_9ALTE|nr:ergothioneine biosynthesis protein EgtB [Aestuariibacter sp. AA17]MCV2886202.1 ergothioneine biosynthesis protein EgtB [Aestuariibacter sp. AA17]